MSVSETTQLAIPQTVEELTLLEFQEIPINSSSGAATTGVGSTDLHLDSGYINQTPLKATTADAIKVPTSVFQLTTGVFTKVSNAEGSPQYQKKGYQWMNHWRHLLVQLLIQPLLVENQMIPLTWVMV
ncbi:hypothetical protein Hanom_Chr17g01574941 [Helianthus anomalus]